MNEELAENLCGLLRRLLESYIDYPRDLAIEYRPFNGRVDWRITANVNDQGKLVGKQGAHIKAVQFLMDEIGDRHGEQFVVRLQEPHGTREREVLREPAVGEFDFSEHKNLLCDVLREVVAEPIDVEVEKGTDPASGHQLFTFKLLPNTINGLEILIQQVEGSGGLTVVASLGTLFRAAAHRDGVKFKIEVETK